MRIRKLLPVLGFLAIFVSGVRGQDEDTIQKLFRDAIEAMGGDKFLNVKDMTSEGQYFAFNNEGDNSGLIRFVDYTKLPDKSRHESGNKKNDLEITVFNLEKNEGWLYDPVKGAREAKPEEMKEFRNVVKHSLDIVFRTRYKDPDNKLFYLGPGEGSDIIMELVKIVDPENDETTVYFDRISKLPTKIEYRELNRRGVRVRMVDEYSQWHLIQGVNTPMRMDGYVNGRRASQNFVLKIAYNTIIPDSFFSKPTPPK
jgi:hypothetical protein